MNIYYKIALLIVGLQLAGCVSTGESVETQFYRLESPGLTSMTQSGQDADYLVVGPISFADYLSRPAMVESSGNNRFTIGTSAQWGGALKDEFQIALLKNLAARKSEKVLIHYPSNLKLEKPQSIRVSVLRFDAEQGGNARLEAIWFLRDHNGEVQATGRFSETTPTGNSAQANAASLSLLVASLANSISEFIE